LKSVAVGKQSPSVAGPGRKKSRPSKGGSESDILTQPAPARKEEQTIGFRKGQKRTERKFASKEGEWQKKGK